MANQLSVQQEIEKLKQNKLFLIIGVLLFAVVMVWVGVSLFTSQQRTRITAEQTKMAAPLQPTLDTSILDTLDDKPFYSDAELESFTIYKIINNRDGAKFVVPIETNEEEFNETVQQQEEPAESVNLLETLNTPAISTGSGLNEQSTSSATPFGETESATGAETEPESSAPDQQPTN